MVNKTTQLGGTASSVTVAKIGHGLMTMTWVPTPVADEVAFESIKAGIDALPPGAKMLLNSAEFYGMNPPTANLELLARFFTAHPGYADKTFLSVKGGRATNNEGIDASPANLRRSVDTVLATLRGTKHLDLFECARVDPKVPVEEAVATLAALVAEGKFDHIGLSECSANTLRRANAVHPIAAVEIEVSLWSYFDETRKVIATAKELGVSVVAYSPLGRGLITGKITKLEDVEEGDIRRSLARFNEENMEHNLANLRALKAVADKKGITVAQLSIAWVSALGSHVIPLAGSSKKTRTLENLEGGDIELSGEDLAEINEVMETHTIMGHRVRGDDPNSLLWG